MGKLGMGLVCAALVFGCGKSKKDDAKKTAKPKPTAAPVVTDASPKTAAGPKAATASDAAPITTPSLTAKTIAELPAVSAVPPLDTKLVKWNHHRESRKLNNKGYKLHKAKKFTEAAAAYTQAVKLDAFNLLARYNLASIWLQTGQAAKALRLLSQYKRADCEVCQGILVHARTDKEWAGIRDHAVFKEITADAKVETRTVKDGAKAFEKSIEKEKVTKNLARFIHPHRAIKADGRHPRGIRELTRWIKKATPDDGSGYYEFFTIEERQTCDAKCCTYKVAPSDTAASLQTLCFKKAPGGVLVLSKIGMYEYMRGMEN